MSTKVHRDSHGVAGGTASRRISRAAAALLTVVGLAVLAGCGGGGGSKSSAATGKSSIKIMTIGNWTQPAVGTSNPEFPAGAQAAVKAINATGGVNGRKLDLIVCSDEGDQNVARNCATKAISEKVAAVVGLQTFNSNVVLPLLDRAGIPAVAVVPFAKVDFTSPNSFVDNGGNWVNWGGGILALKQAGAHKVGGLAPTGFVSSFFNEYLKKAAEHAGMEWAGTVLIPPNTSDLSAVIAAATKGGIDGLYGYAGDEASFIQALQQNAPNVKLATTPFNLSPQVIKSLGSKADGVYVAPETAPPDADVPGVKAFEEQLKAFNSSLPPTQIGLHEWNAVRAFAEVVKKLDDVTPETVTSAYKGVRDLDMQGVTPPLSTQPNGSGDFSRMFNRTSYPAVVKDGKLVPLNTSQPFVTSFWG